MAIAPLGFSVDTSQVAKATGDLSKLTSETKKADDAIGALGKEAANAGTGVDAAATAAKAAAAANDNMAKAARAAQQQMRNLSFQFQDIGTMLAAGQSPFMLLAQQLPQITMYGGKLTGVMGALKSTLAGLLSPLGLITTGFVLAVSAAMSFFSSSEDSAAKQSEELEKTASLINRVAEEWGDAVPAIASYADELERVLNLQELQVATAAAIGREFDDSMEALKNFNLNLSDFSEWNAESQALVENIGQLSRAANELEEIQKEGGDTTKAFADMQTLVSNIINSAAVPATGSLRDRVNELANAYANATDRAQEAANAAAMLAARGGVAVSGIEGGRGSDPRDVMGEDAGGYWRDRFFPDPEKAAAKPRAPRKASTRKTEAEKAAENYKEMIRDSQQFIQQQQLEAQALGMTEEAAAAMRYEQELLNEAANDNIKLTPEMAAELKNYAVQMADAEAATARLKEQIDFADDLTRGFLDDMANGLRNGESVWESFSKAAINALDKILDKLLDMATDQLITGLLGSLLGGATGGFGTTGGFMDMLLGNAKGNAFSGGNVVPFARGGIVSKPTLFPMAKGAGLMGEAGPEGIMPLRRDSQGNLGVIASGGGGTQQVQVDVGVTVDDEGKIQAYVMRTSQQVTAEGIKQYDKSSPQRLPRDARAVKSRMGAI